MNIKQVEWAESHDWCKYAFEEIDGRWSVVGETQLVDMNHNVITERLTFNDYQELREWAGY